MRYDMTDEEAVEWDRRITAVCARVCRGFPGVNPEDVAQGLWVRVCSLPESLDYARPGVQGILKVLAKAEAWKQRTDHLKATCQYMYRPADVRKILETAFDREDWLGSYVPDDAKSWDSGTMDPVDLRADVTACFDRLPENYQSALTGRYRDGVLPEKDTAARKRLDRAVWYLTDLLNALYWDPGKGIVTNQDVLDMMRDLGGG